MAADKEGKKLERIVTIPLRAGLLKKARDNRTKRAIYEIRQYAFRHTGAEEVKVSKSVNEFLWRHGIQKPPSKLKVKLSVSEGVAKVMLPDEKEELKEEKRGAAAALKDRLTGKSAAKPQDVKEQAKTEPPKENAAAAERPSNPVVSTSGPMPPTAELSGMSRASLVNKIPPEEKKK